MYRPIKTKVDIFDIYSNNYKVPNYWAIIGDGDLIMKKLILACFALVLSTAGFATTNTTTNYNATTTATDTKDADTAKDADTKQDTATTDENAKSDDTQEKSLIDKFLDLFKN